MTVPIRIGIVGTGFGRRVHLPAFRLDARCEATAICATTAEHAKKAAEEAGVRGAYGDFSEMLGKGGVDAIAIAAPPKAQPGLIVAAARAGKHVFCEKPLAATEGEAAKALAAVESAGVTHAINFIFPEIGAWRRAAETLKQGAIGKLRHAALTWRIETYSFATGAADSWKSRETEGGGALSNFMSHSLYYLEWLLGPAVRVAAKLGGDGTRSARVDAWIETVAGCPVTASVANDAFRGTGHRLEIFGEQGTLVLNNPTSDYVKGFELSVATREGGEFRVVAAEPASAGDGRIGATAAIVKRFVDGIVDRKAVTPNLSEGMRVQKLIGALRESHKTESWQRV